MVVRTFTMLSVLAIGGTVLRAQSLAGVAQGPSLVQVSSPGRCGQNVEVASASRTPDHNGKVIIDPRNSNAVSSRHSGGPITGIARSTDADWTWTKVTRGLPTGEMGPVGLAIETRKRS